MELPDSITIYILNCNNLNVPLNYIIDVGTP